MHITFISFFWQNFRELYKCKLELLNQPTKPTGWIKVLFSYFFFVWKKCKFHGFMTTGLMLRVGPQSLYYYIALVERERDLIKSDWKEYLYKNVLSVCLSVRPSVCALAVERINFFKFCFRISTYDLPMKVKFVNGPNRSRPPRKTVTPPQLFK